MRYLTCALPFFFASLYVALRACWFESVQVPMAANTKLSSQLAQASRLRCQSCLSTRLLLLAAAAWASPR